MAPEQDPTYYASLFRSWQVDQNVAARDELIERCIPWLRAYVRPRLSADLRVLVDSGDVVNDGLLGLLQYGPRFMPESDRQLFGLIGRIVFNRILDTARGELPKRAHRRLDSSGISRIGPQEDSSLRPDRQAQKAEDRQRLLLAIELLSDEDRRIVRMRSLEEMEYTEVARIMDLEVGATRKRHERAIIRLGSMQRQIRSGDLGDLGADGLSLPDLPVAH